MYQAVRYPPPLLRFWREKAKAKPLGAEMYLDREGQRGGRHSAVTAQEQSWGGCKGLGLVGRGGGRGVGSGGGD